MKSNNEMLKEKIERLERERYFLLGYLKQKRQELFKELAHCLWPEIDRLIQNRKISYTIRRDAVLAPIGFEATVRRKRKVSR
jgi:hypothetical protein